MGVMQSISNMISHFKYIIRIEIIAHFRSFLFEFSSFNAVLEFLILACKEPIAAFQCLNLEINISTLTNFVKSLNTYLAAQSPLRSWNFGLKEKKSKPM